MVTITTTRHELLQQCLTEFLSRSGWKSLRRTAEGDLLASYAEDRAKVVFVFGQENRNQIAEAAYVQVLDDALSERPLDAANCEPLDGNQLFALRVEPSATAVRQIRLGRDLLFPFLRNDELKARLLARYRDLVSEKLGTRPGSDRPAPQLVARRPRSKTEQKTLGDITQRGGKCLIAFDSTYEQSSWLQSEPFEDHIQSFLARDDNWRVCLPLFISAEEVRAVGLARAIRDALSQATDLTFSERLASLIVKLGYVHLYIPEIERLRVDYDLDPNTMFIANILFSTAPDGCFTLTCDRQFVFPSPDLRQAAAEPADREAAPMLLTLGDRFFWDTRLALFDGRIPDMAEMQQIEEWAEDKRNEAKKTIALNSQGRLSEQEADELLFRLARQELSSAGHLLRRSELSAAIRSIVTEERLRLANVAHIEAAVLGSKALKTLDTGEITFHSRILSGWLVAAAISDAIQTITYDTLPLNALMNARDLPYWVWRWGLRHATSMVEDGELIRQAVAHAVQLYGLTGRAGAEGSVALENVMDVLLAAAEACADTDRSGADFLRSAIEEGAHVVNLTLPQIFLSNLKLKGWKFIGCNLRAAKFVGCDFESASFEGSFLGGATFEKCGFDANTNFRAADLSGARFANCETLQAVFDSMMRASDLSDSNWTAVDIINCTGVRETIPRELTDKKAPATAMTVVDKVAEGNLKDSETIKSNLDYMAALWHAKNAEAPVIFHSGHDEIIISSPEKLSTAGDWPDRANAPIAADSTLLGDGRVVIALAQNGMLWARYEGQGDMHWRKIGRESGKKSVSILGVAGAKEKAALVHTLYIAVWQSSEAGDNSISVRSVDVNVYPAEQKQVSFRNRGEASHVEFQQPVHSVHWIRRRGAVILYELIVATGRPQEGYLYSVRRRENSWDKTELWRDFDAPPQTIGFTDRDNVLMACFEGGRMIGYRYLPSGNLTRYFEFYSAVVQPRRVLTLNDEGQMLVLGNPAEGPARPPEQQARPVLCLLLNSSGNVLSVFEHATEQVDSYNYKRGEWQERKETDDDMMAVLKQVAGTMRGFEVVESNPLIEPRHRSEIPLGIKLPDDLHLPLSVRDRTGQRFQAVEVEIKTRDETPLRPTSRRWFNECDLKVERSETEIAVTVPVKFRENAGDVDATLRLRYLGEPPADDPLRPFEHAFHCKVEWMDNPFIRDGVPVSGEQFFGMEQDLGICINRVKRKQAVVIRAARRSGKSSFLLRSAEILRSEPHKLVSVVVSGDRIGGAISFIDDLKAQLNELVQKTRTNEYRGLADSLTGASAWACLINLGNTVQNRGLNLPVVIFVDEWGKLSEDFIEQAGGNVNALKSANVVLCPAGIPANFKDVSDHQGSEFYRYLHTWLDIGQLDESGLEELIDKGLKPRKFAIARNALDLVKKLSSLAPDDANRIMHYAFAAAKADAEKKGGKKEIQLKHVTSKAIEDNLLQKYRALSELHIDMVKEERRQYYLNGALANDGPPWERPDNPIKIPLTSAGDKLDLSVFSDAGYRRRLPEASRDARYGPFQLWIPRGLTLYLREYAREARGEGHGR